MTLAGSDVEILPLEVRVVENRRACDANTCGQAAIATLLGHFRAGPFAAGLPEDDGAAIDRVRERFGPDLPLRLGTSVHRIVAALRDAGLDPEILHAGILGGGLVESLARVARHTSRGIPVPVCVDDGMLGGPPFGAHWAIVRRVEDGWVTLGNARVPRVPLDLFIRAWRCRHLPYFHGRCAVLTYR